MCCSVCSRACTTCKWHGGRGSIYLPCQGWTWKASAVPVVAPVMRMGSPRQSALWPTLALCSRPAEAPRRRGIIAGFGVWDASGILKHIHRLPQARLYVNFINWGGFWKIKKLSKALGTVSWARLAAPKPGWKDPAAPLFLFSRLWLSQPAVDKSHEKAKTSRVLLFIHIIYYIYIYICVCYFSALILPVGVEPLLVHSEAEKT